MEKSEKEITDEALSRQKEPEEEKEMPLEALEEIDTPIYELLKAREVPRKWKGY